MAGETLVVVVATVAVIAGPVPTVLASMAGCALVAVRIPNLPATPVVPVLYPVTPATPGSLSVDGAAGIGAAGDERFEGLVAASIGQEKRRAAARVRERLRQRQSGTCCRGARQRRERRPRAKSFVGAS